MKYLYTRISFLTDWSMDVDLEYKAMRGIVYLIVQIHIVDALKCLVKFNQMNVMCEYVLLLSKH